VYLKNQGLLSYQRTAEVFGDLPGVSLSEGTLAAIDRRCARRLEPVVQEIKDCLLLSPVRHYDETGMSINRKLAWLHSTSTRKYTCYYPHSRRGAATTEYRQSPCTTTGMAGRPGPGCWPGSTSWTPWPAPADDAARRCALLRSGVLSTFGA
jgi:hypothetical protein